MINKGLYRDLQLNHIRKQFFKNPISVLTDKQTLQMLIHIHFYSFDL
jgi:hypothetical protein